MSVISGKRSKIRLNVKDKQQNNVFLDVSPDDTFETLQLRAEKEIGLALDLKQFSYCGQRINPEGNVTEYFHSITKAGNAPRTAGRVQVLGEVEQRPASVAPPVQKSDMQPHLGDKVPGYSEDKQKSVGVINVNQSVSVTDSICVQGTNVSEDIHRKHSPIPISYTVSVGGVSSDTRDVRNVVNDGVELKEEEIDLLVHDSKCEVPKEHREGATMQGDVKDKLLHTVSRTRVPLGTDTVPSLEQMQDVMVNTTRVERMEKGVVDDTVVLRDEVDHDSPLARAVEDGECGPQDDPDHTEIGSLGDSSQDTDSIVDLAEDLSVGQLCRLCGEEKTDMVFIFGEEGINLCLKEKITSWLPISVKRMDQFPKQVCESCIDKVILCQEFGAQCLRTQRFLQKLIECNRFRCKIQAAKSTLTNGNGVSYDDKYHHEEIEKPKVENNSTLEQMSDDDGSSRNTLCCPLCVTGVMTLRSCEDVEDSEVSSGEEDMEYDETDLLAAKDTVPFFANGEHMTNHTSSAVAGSSPEDDLNMEYDESAFLVETVLDSIPIVPEDKGTEALTEAVVFPQKRGRQRGRARGSRGRGLLRGRRAEQPRSRARGRGRGRGRARRTQQLLEAPSYTPLSCCLCGMLHKNMNDAFLHTLLSHTTEPHFFQCCLCGDSSTDRSGIISHFREVHSCKVTAYERFGDKITLLYECKECSTVFRSEKTLCGHNCFQKFESKSLKCSLCGKTFVTKARLSFHQQFHWNESRPMYCEVCNLDFADEDTMYDHFKFTHRGEKFVCSVCGTHFNSKTGCDTHEQMHTNKLINKRTFTCDVCSKSFFDKQTLKEHVVSHMETRPYQCHICGRDLSRPSRLKRHLKAHASYNAPPQDIYRCTTCDEVFCNQESAYAHTQEDQPECKVECGAEHEFAKESVDKVYRCEFCEKCYSAPGVLDYHRSSHIDDPMPYRCHICGTPHVSFARCATHKVTHGLFIDTDVGDFTVPKYYLCEFCGKYYLHWTYLSVHRRRRHSSVKYLVKGKNVFKPEVPQQSKPHECDKCGRRYLLEWALAKHMKRHHSGDDSSSYQCDHCGKVFTCKNFLESHMVVHGEKTFACELCDSTYLRASSLSIHMGRVHTTNKQHCCEHCGLEFLRKNDLTEHIRTHTGDRPFECEYCKKSFRTRGIWLQHTRIHKDERPYPCGVCGAAFRRSFALKNHMTLHTGVRAFVCEVCGKDFRMHQELTKHLKTRHAEKDGEIKQEAVSEESTSSRL